MNRNSRRLRLARPTIAYVSGRSLLFDYGGGVVIVAAIGGIIAYPVAVFLSAKDPLRIATHASYIAGFAALLGALEILAARGW